MISDKIKAFVLTCIIVGGVGYWLLGAPDVGLSDLWTSIRTSLMSEDKPQKNGTKKLVSSGKEGVSIDKYNGVKIYDNGSVGNVTGRNVTSDGYNLGLKYQCVEFVKRFYYEYYNHKMPDSYGHARDFYDTRLSDGAYNKSRNLTQYSNGSSVKPQTNDLIVFGPTPYNEFGHVAIISRVSTNQIEIAQQNPGRGNSSRATYFLSNSNGKWTIGNQYVKGWLRK